MMTLQEKLLSIAREESCGVMHEIDGRWWFCTAHFLVTVPEPFEFEQISKLTKDNVSRKISEIMLQCQMPIEVGTGYVRDSRICWKLVDNHLINAAYFHLAPPDAKWHKFENDLFVATSGDFQLYVMPALRVYISDPCDPPLETDLYQSKSVWFKKQIAELEQYVNECVKAYEDASADLDEAQADLASFIEKHGSGAQ